MCKIIFILLLIIECTICISNNSKPLQAVPLVKRKKPFSSIPTPTTYDRIPVFGVFANGHQLNVPRNFGGYAYFMDFSDASSFLVDCYMMKIFDQKNFGNIVAISLKDWFELVDPSVERVDGYREPKLKPSCVQDQKHLYKLKGIKNHEPIPVYYSEGLKVSRKTLWNLFKKAKKERNVYFFNINDLNKQIESLENKVEREMAKSKIKIVSLFDLLKQKDVKELLFVMNSKNLETISDLTSTPTPWVV